MSKIAPLETICLNLIDGCEQHIDTATCNGELMLLLAGVGFEQQMIEKADRSKKNTRGQLAYLKGLWEAIGQNDVHEFAVQLNDEEPFTIKTPSLTIANAAPTTTLLAQGKGVPNIMNGEEREAEKQRSREAKKQRSREARSGRQTSIFKRHRA